VDAVQRSVATTLGIPFHQVLQAFKHCTYSIAPAVYTAEI
jgi:hypothetical protein